MAASNFKTAIQAAEGHSLVQELLSINQAFHAWIASGKDLAYRYKQFQTSLSGDDEGQAVAAERFAKAAADASAELNADKDILPVIVAMLDGLGFVPKG